MVGFRYLVGTRRRYCMPMNNPCVAAMPLYFLEQQQAGRPGVFSQAERKADAERRKKQQAADDKTAPASPSSMTSPGELRVTQVGKKPTVCGTKTKAGDLIEFRCANNPLLALCVFEYWCYSSKTKSCIGGVSRRRKENRVFRYRSHKSKRASIGASRPKLPCPKYQT